MSSPFIGGRMVSSILEKELGGITGAQVMNYIGLLFDELQALGPQA